MPILLLARRCRRLLPALAAALLSFAAGAADTPPQQVDRSLQSLKEEAVSLARDLQVLEQAALFPDQSRTTLYVGVKVGGFYLTEITVRIDESQPVTHVYSDSESKAFLKDGWHRLMRASLQPGSHRVSASFKGRFFDSRPNDPLITGKLETLFEKGLSELDLILPISRNTRLDKPGLPEVSRLESRKLRPSRNVWLPQPERFESALSSEVVGGVTDPRYHTALFLRHDGRYFSALTELLDIAAGVPDPAALPIEYHWLLADSYLGFGMQAPAERTYRQIAASKAEPVDIYRARIELARFEYQRGYQAKATDSLLQLRKDLPKQLFDDWLLLLANTLLAQGRYNEAVEALSKADLDDLSAATRYNLAVALIRDGRVAQGRKQLNQVGTMDVNSIETLALRDKANLTLGYHYLQAQQGENAKEVFGRIRTQGPFSNRALLGLGWAELAPRNAPRESMTEAEGKNSDASIGSLLRPGFVDPNARSRLKLGEKAGSGLSPEERDSLMQALVIWTELGKRAPKDPRDPIDPAVLEGLLAIPWAFDKLSAFEQSLARYQDAIAALETARKRMDEAMKSIRGGRMVETLVSRDLDSEKGWMWRLRDLPDAPETYYLQTLLAEHRFQEQVKNYRDARLLTRNLESWRERLVQLAQRGGDSGGKLSHQMARAKEDWRPAWAGMVVWLRYDNALGAPGIYDAPLTLAGGPTVDLLTAQPPEKFEGTNERVVPMMRRVEELRPRLSDVGGTQSRLLQQNATAELEGQKKVIERYLTEARFAVARIYDRQRQGGP